MNSESVIPARLGVAFGEAWAEAGIQSILRRSKDFGYEGWIRNTGFRVKPGMTII